MRHFHCVVLFLAACLAGTPASTTAAEIYLRQFTPQGEVRDGVRATAVFSGDMTALGASEAPAPFEVQCSVPGSGRWSDARTWSYTLRRALNPGERCRFLPRQGLTGVHGEEVSLAEEYGFSAPGPWIQRMQPYKGARIEEDQAFVVQTRMPVTPASVTTHAWCESEGVGERIPVRVLPANELAALARTLEWQGENNLLALQCARPLPPGAKASLVWGRGIASSAGAVTQDDDVLTFQVRLPFRAELTCEREKPSAPCSPLSDLRLQFSDQVNRSLAEKIELAGAGGVQRPWQPGPERQAALKKQGQRPPRVQAREDYTDSVVFPGPFPPNAAYTLKLPAGFADISGRPLENAASFPLATRVGALPPLAKFAADFGILELQEGGILPVTLRNVERQLSMRVLRETESAAAVSTLLELMKLERQTVPSPAKSQENDSEDGELVQRSDPYYPRELSYLAGRSDATTRSLPKPGGVQPFEVVGIPLSKPGYYVVEIESKLLGAALLSQAKPMYVRGTALVTDMAVHFKRGRDNSLVWVTALSTGKPVAAAEVEIYDCRGQRLWQGGTDKQGRASVETALEQPSGCEVTSAFFVTARNGADFSFARSDWDRGIESWRFNVDTWGWNSQQSPVIHTVLDRTLLRAGETVSMKHIARIPHAQGYRYPRPDQLPKTLLIERTGGEEPVSLPLTWDTRGIATSQWQIPQTAKLGSYSLKIGDDWEPTATFRVSEFRLPAFQGAVQGEAPRLASVREVPLRLSLAWLNSGAARGQPVQLSALMSAAYPDFPRYREFSFGLERDERNDILVADKQPLRLDAHGGAAIKLPLPQKVDEPMRLHAEMTFNDANGEVQTIAGSTELWPARVLVGARVPDWAGMHGRHRVEAVALDLQGQPVAGIPIAITGERHWQYVHRKRVLGGFYSYEEEQHSADLGRLCQGKTDARGLFRCEITVEDAGQVRLHVSGRDAQGNVSQADTGFWASGDGDLWFSQQDDDRMDVIPEKREYAPGDTARLQVHTPFHDATALVTVEREGIVESFVRPLPRRDALVEIPVGKNWGPNVYVSVLAVRGRLHEVPWYSFFQWGWRSPRDWWQSWRAGVPQPGAMVDLARPAFKYGLARLDVGNQAVRLKVDVAPEKSVYRPRAQATVRLQVRLPDGRPAPAGSEVAVAAVDRALLELAPNPTWDLLESMQQERPYLVETATAQMQVVGKRHFGKKALPAGGGGGKLSSRELFDTLLYWNPRVRLDANGSASIKVPLNDSLTAFRIVAVADVGPDLYGTGSAEITSTQDLQIVSGLPPLVREGDRYRAMTTLRNTTAKSMQLTVRGNAGSQPLAPQRITLQAGEAREVAWNVQVPEADSLAWHIEAVDDKGHALDRIKLQQRIQPRVPVTVQQASFLQLGEPHALPVQLPQGALPGKGGIQVQLSASLAQQTEGLTRYFESYPYSCLEQKVSVAAGLADQQRWAAIVRNLPGYVDAEGLLQYFPGAGRGSDALTAYVLTVAQASGVKLPAETEARLQQALLDFAEGRITPPAYWGGSDYLKERRLAALAALSGRGVVQGRMLTPFEFKPARMATASLLDWYALLRQVPDAPQRAERLKQVERELRNRLSYAGGRLVFSSEADDDWWWLMLNGEVNALRLLHLAIDDPTWQDDLPGLLRGALLRQRQGHWSTTVANVWGRLALAKFGQRFESAAVVGQTGASLGGTRVSHDWAKANTAQLQLAWPVAAGVQDLALEHKGEGRPWAGLSVLAAVPGQPQESGYRLRRSVTAVEQKVPGQWSRGDLLRVRIDVDAGQPLSWVVLSDPIPGGASILGNTARDSAIARQDENRYDGGENRAWPLSTERGLGFFRAYYEYVPKGHFWVEYTLRLNNPGNFSLPPTRVEAMYAPEIFGQQPNAGLEVQP